MINRFSPNSTSSRLFGKCIESLLIRNYICASTPQAKRLCAPKIKLEKDWRNRSRPKLWHACHSGAERLGPSSGRHYLSRRSNMLHLPSFRHAAMGAHRSKPRALMLTRPDRKTAVSHLRDYRTEALGEDASDPFPLTIIGHPNRVRHRAIRMYESKVGGAFLKNRGSDVRLSTSDKPS